MFDDSSQSYTNISSFKFPDEQVYFILKTLSHNDHYNSIDVKYLTVPLTVLSSDTSNLSRLNTT